MSNSISSSSSSSSNSESDECDGEISGLEGLEDDYFYGHNRKLLTLTHYLCQTRPNDLTRIITIYCRKYIVGPVLFVRNVLTEAERRH
jgi:hypothetical protein